MLLLNISEKIKNHDIYQSITKDLIEENSPHVYFSVAHGFFILREIISNLKNGDFEINAGKEIQKLVEMFSEDFQKMNGQPCDRRLHRARQRSSSANCELR